LHVLATDEYNSRAFPIFIIADNFNKNMHEYAASCLSCRLRVTALESVLSAVGAGGPPRPRGGLRPSARFGFAILVRLLADSRGAPGRERAAQPLTALNRCRTALAHFGATTIGGNHCDPHGKPVRYGWLPAMGGGCSAHVVREDLPV
jgi:hypothetical protein